MKPTAAAALALLAVAAAPWPGAAGVPLLDPTPRVESSARAWRLVASEHFSVRTDAGPAVYGPLIARLEDVHQALTAGLFPGLPLAPVEVLLFARQRDYLAVAPDNLVGFFTSNMEGFEDGLLVLSAEGSDFQAVAATAAHELAHQFLHAWSEKIPTWLHEGFAKYVGALEVAGDRVVFDAAAASPGFALSRPVPLARLYASAGGDFLGADARAQYLTAWMLMRQLLRHPDSQAIARFGKLLARSALSHDPAAQAAAVSEAFGGLSAEQLERTVGEAHRALVAGRATARGKLSVRLRRGPRAPLRVQAGDARRIQALCAALQARRRA